MNKINLALIALLLLTSKISASEVGFIKQFTGVVKIKRVKNILTVKQQDKVYRGDIIITKKNSTVCIILTTGEVITLEENSVLPINKHLSKKEGLKKHLSMNL
jgi:hypothetical protein